MTTDLTVLVVDDDFMVAGIHTKFVQRTPGFVVLLDVHLPDRTGIDVLRELRAAGDDTGVVMVTAAREAETVRAAAAGGAAHYLVKPFEYDDLRARLEAFRAAHT